MPASYEKQIEVQKAKEELAESKLRTLRLEQTYRALDGDHNRRRRSAPTIEFKGEDDIIGSHKRLLSVAKARDTRRNYSGAKATETQLWLNVIGRGPKLIAHFDDEAKTEEWSNWFNSTFSKRCDGRGDRHLADQGRNVLSAVVREGDMLAYFDMHGLIPDAQGTLWYWEADQICAMAEKSFQANGKKIKRALGAKGAIKQAHGLVMDEWGRVLGYIVAKGEKRGLSSVNYEESTVLPAAYCKLVMNPFRVNQKRGISDTIEIANCWQDLERFTEAMIQRSIVQSFLAFKVKKTGGIIAGRDAAYDSDNPNGVPDVTSDDVSDGTRYKNYEKLSMNAIEYLDDGEDIEAMQLAGDLPDAQNLIDFIQGNAGWSQGLSAMYATGKADASYSASMAEANMTWAMFLWWQKFMERYYFDWVAAMAFEYGVRYKKITPASRIMWEDNYSWHNWPERRAINPAQEATARKTDLEIGAIDYSDIHGPYWKKKLQHLGEQIKWSRDNGLFVPLFQPSNGGGNG